MEKEFCQCLSCKPVKPAPICNKCGKEITEPHYEYTNLKLGNLCPMCAAIFTDQIPIPRHVAVFLMRFGLLKGVAQVACKDYNPYDGDYVGLENAEWADTVQDTEREHLIIWSNGLPKEIKGEPHYMSREELLSERNDNS